ncbi:MAG: sigma-70 family RNA polymerase sigma factor [Proteobacteria bacterium]|nr:sigma-70 family RNA polymerase sigma factor [Pseudomonadota bacterium]
MSPAAFRAALGARYPGLRRYARRLARHRDDGDDLAHDTALRALANAERFDGAHLDAWLVTICRRLWLDRIRRDRVERAALTPALHSACLCRQEAAVRLAELRKQVSRLSPRERTVVLRDARGDSGGEIAHAIGVPAGTVRSRLWRARRRLAEFAA